MCSSPGANIDEAWNEFDYENPNALGLMGDRKRLARQ
jgi:hypothetical protein